MLRRLTRSPRLRTICRVVVYARRNPARINRHIISEFGRIAPKCSLICGKVRGGLPKRGTLYEFAPFPLRGIFAMTTTRQPSARSAENPSAAWKPIYSPDRGKHPMRKTMTAVARDAAIWREHKRHQRSGEQDETRLKGVTPARLDDGERYDKRHPHEAIIEQTLCDNAHTIFAKREDSQVKQRFGDCALTRDEQCDARDPHKHRHPYERQLEGGFFPSKRRLGPKVFRLGAKKTRPLREARNRICRKGRFTRASSPHWGRASR